MKAFWSCPLCRWLCTGLIELWSINSPWSLVASAPSGSPSLHGWVSGLGFSVTLQSDECGRLRCRPWNPLFFQPRPLPLPLIRLKINTSLLMQVNFLVRQTSFQIKKMYIKIENKRHAHQNPQFIHSNVNIYPNWAVSRTAPVSSRTSRTFFFFSIFTSVG